MKSSEERKLAAKRFVDEWRNRGQEDEDDQTFWNQFLGEVLGMDRVHHEIDYQKKVKIGKPTGKIDAYIPSSKVLIEQKSLGVDLRKPLEQSDGRSLTPFEQALRYAAHLPTNESPNFIITSNFVSFLIYDRNKDPNGDNPTEITLEELPANFTSFDFIIDPINARIEKQEQVSKEAARIIGTLYKLIKEQYRNPSTKHSDLAILMVRILFCLYAEDSGLFEKNLFYRYLNNIPVVNLPLKDYHHVVCANALRTDWNTILPTEQCSYIMGNPPFVGYSNMDTSQKEDVRAVFANTNSAGTLDYVAAWYKTAADYAVNTKIKCAFVSTNSITQGQQVAPIWKPLFERGIKINFAYRTFIWSSEAIEMAHVHCVIIGFSYIDNKVKRLFTYENGKDKQRVDKVGHINAYLANAVDAFIAKRRMPICDVPIMIYGNKPVDGGFLSSLTEVERNELLNKEPQAKKFVKQILGSEEFINGTKRYCLWLLDANPTLLRSMPLIKERIEKVKKFRLTSKKAATREGANTPTLFMEIRQPPKKLYHYTKSIV